MAKSNRRKAQQKTRNERRKERYAAMDNTRPEGDSTYARKRRWLHGSGLFGFQVAEPKPWKSERGPENLPAREPTTLAAVKPRGARKCKKCGARVRAQRYFGDYVEHQCVGGD